MCVLPLRWWMTRPKLQESHENEISRPQDALKLKRLVIQSARMVHPVQTTSNAFVAIHSLHVMSFIH